MVNDLEKAYEPTFFQISDKVQVLTLKVSMVTSVCLSIGSPQTGFAAYPRRWVVLGVVMLLNVSNAAVGVLNHVSFDDS